VTAWLRITLAAQLAFFAAWGGQLLTSHRDVGVVWLATEPVDPRDLLSGHYVALRYAIASGAIAQCEALPTRSEPRTVWVQLDESGETIATPGGSAVVSEAVRCVTEPPPPASAVWIRGTLDAQGHIAYGIERMFVGEDNSLRQAPSGSIVAQVALNDEFEPRLLTLMARHGSTETPEDHR
jgi:uncharacterized membrane-anchored protein